MNKAQKLVKMVELMARRGGVRSTELMERFELDARTLRRYLSDLRELGLPLQDDGRGDDRLVSMDPQWRRTGVQLTLSEVLSLHFGRKLFNFLEGTTYAEGIDGALERLQPAISRTDKHLAQQLDTRFLAVPEPAKDYRGHSSDVLDDLVTALLYNHTVHCRYRKPSGVESQYELHPYTLATFRQGLYLFALDVQAGVVKTFAVERFTDLVRRWQERFEMPHGWQPEAHIAHAFGIIAGSPQPVVLAFEPQVAGYIRERTWHPTQTFTTHGDGRILLRMSVALTVELETWILGFGPSAEVLGPTLLRERIAAQVEQTAQRYRAQA